jgi:ribosome-binding factor A
MSSRRVLKAAEAIREVVSMAILTEVRDPRVKNVTVTMVELAPDMKTAKIHVSVMGDAKQEKLSLLGLQNSAGFLQSRIADRIDTRYTPRLSFEIDKGVKNSLEVARILAEVLPKPPAPPPPTVEMEDGEAEEEEMHDATTLDDEEVES